jgi:hypothetical protein
MCLVANTFPKLFIDELKYDKPVAIADSNPEEDIATILDILNGILPFSKLCLLDLIVLTPNIL